MGKPIKLTFYLLLFGIFSLSANGKVDPVEIQNAIRLGDLELIEIYLDKKLDPNYKINDAEILKIAAINNQTEIMKILLKNGANPNLFYDQDPLSFWLVRNYREEALRLLIDYGCDIEIANDTTTLMGLSMYRMPLSFILFLIDSGVNLEFKDEDSRTYLSNAIFNNKVELATFLIQNGADVNYITYSDSSIWTDISYYVED